MRLLIAGGGWYGCHLATVLLELGHQVTILLKGGLLFDGSSAKNQNRLHLGYHYPRSNKTRLECQRGFTEFMRQYGHVTNHVGRNIYLVAEDSLVDFDTFCLIYKDSAEFELIKLEDVPLINSDRFQGAILCEERVIDYNKARRHFEGVLAGTNIIYQCSTQEIIQVDDKYVLRGQSYDCLIDCTYGQATIPKEVASPPVLYELCLTLIYQLTSQLDPDFALTVMDGNFFSLYPVQYDTDHSYYTLTDVAKTPCFASKNIQEIESYKSSLTSEQIAQQKKIIEDRVLEYLPEFNSHFKYVDFWLSCKTKFNNGRNAAADRSVSVTQSNNFIQVFGGKITGILDAVPLVIQTIPPILTENY